MKYFDAWHEVQRERDRERYRRSRAQGWHTLSIRLDDKTYRKFQALARRHKTSLRAVAIEGITRLIKKPRTSPGPR